MLTDEHQARRKKLLWRATHRGIKEMDIIMGGYASARLPKMSADKLDEFEHVLDIPDQELLAWLTGQEPVPAGRRCALLDELLKFRPA
jgi:antitoxin CptB